MAQKKTEQAPLGDKSWGQMMKDAKEKPDVFPKLNMGGPSGKDKLFEGIYDVQILEDEPRSVEYEDPYADEEGAKGIAYVFNVRVLASPVDPVGSNRSLFMRADPDHGLTNGVLSVSRKHGGKLRNVALRIETRNYDNKRYKTKTRGYTVSEIPAPATSAP